jgi:hypothetical protein
LVDYLDASYGKASDWGGFWWFLFQDERDHYADFNASDLPSLIGSAFSENELRSILSSVIEDHAAKIRPRLRKISSKRPLQGSAIEIAQSLTKAECFQLTLLASNQELVQSIERLIRSEIIVIPATENRSAPVKHRATGGWTNQVAQCSKLGVRFVPRRRDLAVPRLKALLKRLHGDEDGLADLEWQLMETSGEDVHSKLDRLVHEADPREIVRDLVLSRRKLFQEMTEYLVYGYFVIPTTLIEKEEAISRILWKLGFHVPVYPSLNDTFWRRLNAFRGVTRRDARDESQREEIRAVAVNFFVSLEEVLDTSVAFTIWSLLSDHYSASRPARFRFNLSKARQAMVRSLDGRDIGNGEKLEINSSGRTTSSL